MLWRPGVTARATKPATRPNNSQETIPTGSTLLKCVADHAAGIELARRRVPRRLAQEHRDRRRVMLARTAGAAAAEVAAEPAVDRASGGGAELHPAELHE